MNKSIKLFLTDIDGVWTDGGMYYSSDGTECKKFNTSDSAGVLFCKLLNIEVGIVTGENSIVVENRAKKLNIQHCYLGVSNKLAVVGGIIKELGIDWHQVAYIGDDINDIEVLKKVGLSACPSNAPYYIKEIVDWPLDVEGGKGAFRCFVEKYLQKEHLLETALNKYFESKKFNQ